MFSATKTHMYQTLLNRRTLEKGKISLKMFALMFVNCKHCKKCAVLYVLPLYSTDK